MQLSFTEENYLKAIFTLSERSVDFVTSTNAIAERLNTKPPTVSDMLRKLTEKKLIIYEKYKKVQLTKKGREEAVQVIRKHRLWEVFLHEKLGFTWDEVHGVAEDLEHIHSEKLIERLEIFLNFPKFDPHGDPIPSAKGEMNEAERKLLSAIDEGEKCKVVGVKDSSTIFLEYLKQIDINIGTKIIVVTKIPFDGSLMLQYNKGQKITVSKKLGDNLFVTS